MLIQFRTQMHYQNNISRVVFRSDFIVGDQHTSGTGLTKRLTDFLRAASAMNRASIFPTMRVSDQVAAVMVRKQIQYIISFGCEVAEITNITSLSVFLTKCVDHCNESENLSNYFCQIFLLQKC